MDTMTETIVITGTKEQLQPPLWPRHETRKIRKTLKGKQKLPQKIFSRQSIHDDYAFHHGGRPELQFNVGIEITDEVIYVRHGVAFSLEPSQSLPSIDVLVPKVYRFNEFIKVHPNLVADLRICRITVVL